MANRGGNLVGKVIAVILTTLITIAVLFCVAVLIYGAIKGLNFTDSFKTMFGINNGAVKETAKNVANIAKYRF